MRRSKPSRPTVKASSWAFRRFASCDWFLTQVGFFWLISHAGRPLSDCERYANLKSSCAVRNAELWTWNFYITRLTRRIALHILPHVLPPLLWNLSTQALGSPNRNFKQNGETYILSNRCRDGCVHCVTFWSRILAIDLVSVPPVGRPKTHRRLSVAHQLNCVRDFPLPAAATATKTTHARASSDGVLRFSNHEIVINKCISLWAIYINPVTYTANLLYETSRKLSQNTMNFEV